ncbi:hypothetical protein Q8A73_009518 [Channa argus]|nr:hypothetical protein Q8A73_009518 [Channa argus]
MADVRLHHHCDGCDTVGSSGCHEVFSTPEERSAPQTPPVQRNTAERGAESGRRSLAGNWGPSHPLNQYAAAAAGLDMNSPTTGCDTESGGECYCSKDTSLSESLHHQPRTPTDDPPPVSPPLHYAVLGSVSAGDECWCNIWSHIHSDEVASERPSLPVITALTHGSAVAPATRHPSPPPLLQETDISRCKFWSRGSSTVSSEGGETRTWREEWRRGGGKTTGGQRVRAGRASRR